MPTGRIFQSGNSQAVRLPKDCRFDCDEVEIIRGAGGAITLLPKGWAALFALLDEDGVTDDFMEEGSEREGLEPAREVESL
ncbi:MAG: AbrB/MazE/SpoVT family DNA-binding domain-containing protein [Akkermansiaceae bacterium]|nr:AbrB/MazE/SpoVT family DNA-binding domain-containing protein [Akkermansiaceae bacterium]NNM29649.1 AbrB/MazE/SpoVT family DNA-binding domain-containing protein [Akkermansiaceae bacterium]